MPRHKKNKSTKTFDKKIPVKKQKQKKERKMKVANPAIVDDLMAVGDSTIVLDDVIDDVIGDVDTNDTLDDDDVDAEDALNFASTEDSADPIDQLTAIDKEEEVLESDIGTIETITENGEYASISPTGKVRPNNAPRIMWCDRIKTKFKSGDLVNLNNTKMVYKVVSTNKDPYTYLVMASGNNVQSSAKESEMTCAPKDSVWKTFWEENDPFKVKGVNISCPSNGKMK